MFKELILFVPTVYANKSRAGYAYMFIFLQLTLVQGINIDYTKRLSGIYTIFHQTLHARFSTSADRSARFFFSKTAFYVIMVIPRRPPKKLPLL